MPTFDPSSSRLDRGEAHLLRSVLGPARPVATSLRVASRDYRRRQRHGRMKRALIVVSLAGSFCGAAIIMSENRPLTTAVATRTSPAGFDPETTGSIGRGRPPAQDSARGSSQWSVSEQWRPEVSDVVK
jgi:hypothetical protein